MPDEKARTAQYSLNLGNAVYARIYTPKMNSDTMDMQIVSTVNGQLNITATETPVFVLPGLNGTNNPNANTYTPPTLEMNTLMHPNQDLETSVLLYPNPVTDNMNLIINNANKNSVSIRILETGSGRVYKNLQYSKPYAYLSKEINLSSLSGGYYIIEIRQGSNKTVRKIFKTYK